MNIASKKRQSFNYSALSTKIEVDIAVVCVYIDCVSGD